MKRWVRRSLWLTVALIALLVLVAFNLIQPNGSTRRHLLEAYVNSPPPEEEYDALEQAISVEVTEALITLGVTPTPSVEVEFIDYLYTIVISSRNRIGQAYILTVFDRKLTPEEIAMFERNAAFCVLDSSVPTCSAIVIEIGGVSSNPPKISVPHAKNVRILIWDVAHEWVHRHVKNQPLARNSGNVMIEEITAEVVAEEVTRVVCRKYGWKMPEIEEEVGMWEELRPIRRTVDALLAEGKVKEAEAYMEKERQRICAESHGLHCPHRLNQAYFATYGKYGGGAAGDDPIPGMVRSLRAQSASLAEFLNDIKQVGSYEEFLDLCEEHGINPDE